MPEDMLSIKGKLIVIDGTDGSGKKTQTQLIVSRLKNKGYNAVYFDFPRHDHPHASLVDDYLNGRFGELKDVGAYKASILYAVDRFGASFDIRKVLQNGGIAICDRYVSANMGHQAGKIHDLNERDKYLEWLEDLEYVKLGIPRPDMNILLFVPTAVSQQLVDKKDQRQYLGEKRRDIHENDTKHLTDASEAFLYVAKKYYWPIIYCAPNGTILPVEDIHEMLWNVIEKKFRI
ncbi:MAG: thymidylate kinase [Candidatus Woesearchaeota archaeon]